MAKVYTGKIEMPFNEMDDYFVALEEAEKEAEPFQNNLIQLNEEFRQYLQIKYSKKTANKHGEVIHVFIDFLCWNTDVRRLEDVTRGIANSYFRKWYMSKGGDRRESELKTAIKKFFQFLDTEKGIRNEVVLRSFRRN